MDRDIAIKVLEALTAIKQDLDAIVVNTTPAGGGSDAEPGDDAQG